MSSKISIIEEIYAENKRAYEQSIGNEIVRLDNLRQKVFKEWAEENVMELKKEGKVAIEYYYSYRPTSPVDYSFSLPMSKILERMSLEKKREIQDITEKLTAAREKQKELKNALLKWKVNSLERLARKEEIEEAKKEEVHAYKIYCFACGATKRVLSAGFGINPKDLLCMDCYLNYQKKGVISLISGDETRGEL